MDFYRNLKEKLSEELAIEESDPINDLESLRTENETLKQRLNDNYSVYVRKLERRKTRMKDLEDRLKEALDNNDSLHLQVESFKKKYEDCKEQLDQLESFQNQELGKVKHMLLSAETALAKERENKHNIEIRTASPLSSNLPLNADQEITTASQLKDLHQKQTDYVSEINQLKSKISEVTSQRDALQTSLLEMEIAKHDGENARSEEIRGKDLKICSLEANIDTLTLTLKVRETEIKSKKEELKEIKSSHQTSMEKVSEQLAQEKTLNKQLQSEYDNLTSQSRQRLMQLRECQKTNDDLNAYIEELQASLKNLENDLESGRFQIKESQEKYETISVLNDRLKSEISDANANMEQVRDMLETVTSENKRLSVQLQSTSDECLMLKSKLDSAKREKSDLERSIPALLDTSELVRDLRNKVVDLEEDLEDKRQAVRHLQLRSSEMKKMLQKEIKSKSPPASPTETASKMVPEVAEHVSDVTLRYLKNVIFKFLTSPETEAKQMTRAVATLLDFSNEEEKRLYEYLEWKVSWFAFGAKPKLTS